MSAAVRIGLRRGVGIACLAFHVLMGLVYTVHWDAELIWTPFLVVGVFGLAAVPIAVLCFHRALGRAWVAALALVPLVLVSDAHEGYLSSVVPSLLVLSYLSVATKLAFMTTSGVALLRRDMGMTALAVLSAALPWWVAAHWFGSGNLVDSMIEFRRTGEPRYHAHLWTVGSVFFWLVWAGLVSVVWHSAVVAVRELTGRPPPWGGDGGWRKDTQAASPRAATADEGGGIDE